MKRWLFLVAVVLPLRNGAETITLPDDLQTLQENQKTQQVEETPEILNTTGKNRSPLPEPIRTSVQLEFDPLKAGILTDGVKRLLQSPEDMKLCLSSLADWVAESDTSGQNAICKQLFAHASSPVLGMMLWKFYTCLKIHPSVFKDAHAQTWLVEAINRGFPAGGFYFLLTEENAKRVQEIARADLLRFSQQGDLTGNARSLTSAAFLAHEGDKQALNMLSSVLRHRSIESIYPLLPLFPAIALTENPDLIAELVEIVGTDQRKYWFGRDHIPQEFSFAQEAAAACHLVIEGFPAVKGAWRFSDEQKAAVEDWVKNHHKWILKKPDDREIFVRLTCLRNLLPVQWKVLQRFAETDGES